LPNIDSNKPWSLFDKNSEYFLKNQLLSILEKLNCIDVSEYSNLPISINISKGPIYVDKTATIGNFVSIEGPCYIGPDVEIRNGAYIRPNCWISSGSIIGHSSEIKNSLLLAKSSAPHFNYVGDSILGYGANIGAGVKIANLRNDYKSILVNNDSEYIDTNIHKLGSLIGDGVRIGCNSVCNPGAIIYSDMAFPPNSTISGLNKEG